ncbi:MAG: hypothetical protein WA172_19985 [Terriglobales bacterium]
MTVLRDPGSVVAVFRPANRLAKSYLPGRSDVLRLPACAAFA